MKNLILIMICPAFCYNLLAQQKTVKIHEVSRYEQLFQVFECGVSEAKLDVRTGMVVKGDVNSISLASLSYWADRMTPQNEDEDAIACRYLKSKIKEVRIIAAMSIMRKFNIRKTTLPSGLSSLAAGYDIESREFQKLHVYLISKFPK